MGRKSCTSVCDDVGDKDNGDDYRDDGDKYDDDEKDDLRDKYYGDEYNDVENKVDGGGVACKGWPRAYTGYQY